MLLYYVTDRAQFPGDESQRREQLLRRIAQAASCGVDFVQLREKDLCTRDLETLAREAIQAIRSSGRKSRLLINSRTDIALAVGADGVHLRSLDVSPSDVRQVWRAAHGIPTPVISVSCHATPEVIAAAATGAGLAIFAPVFEKRGDLERPAAGLAGLRDACGHGIPVLALGGVTSRNAASCVEAGAQGIAGIRLFQEGDLAMTVARLRG